MVRSTVVSPGGVGWSGHRAMIQWTGARDLCVAFDTSTVGRFSELGDEAGSWSLTDGWDSPPNFCASTGSLFIATYGANGEVGRLVSLADGSVRDVGAPPDEEVQPYERCFFVGDRVVGHARQGRRYAIELASGAFVELSKCGREIKYSATGALFATLGTLRETANDAEVFAFPGQPIAVHESGAVLSRQGTPGSALWWTTRSGSVEVTTTLAKEGWMMADIAPAAFSPDGQRIVVMEGERDRARLRTYGWSDGAARPLHAIDLQTSLVSSGDLSGSLPLDGLLWPRADRVIAASSSFFVALDDRLDVLMTERGFENGVGQPSSPMPDEVVRVVNGERQYVAIDGTTVTGHPVITEQLLANELAIRIEDTAWPAWWFPEITRVDDDAPHMASTVETVARRDAPVHLQQAMTKAKRATVEWTEAPASSLSAKTVLVGDAITDEAIHQLVGKVVLYAERWRPHYVCAGTLMPGLRVLRRNGSGGLTREKLLWIGAVT